MNGGIDPFELLNLSLLLVTVALSMLAGWAALKRVLPWTVAVLAMLLAVADLVGVIYLS